MTVRPVLESGRTVSFPAAGGSMRPFFRDGSVLTLKAATRYRRGDIVLARTVPHGPVVLHYVARTGADAWVLMGAANLRQKELCLPGDIAGKVVSPAFRRQWVMLWHLLLPLRRGLMWIYRKIYE